MKKTTLILVLVSLLSACTKDITKLNIDPKHPSSVPSKTLFTAAELGMADNMTSVSENDNIFRLIEQQWTEVQYLTESQYNLPGRNIPDNIWNEFYVGNATNAGPLVNFEQAKKIMLTDVADPGTLKNETAITDMCEVYCYYYLVTTFGNIPYSQALNTSIPFPKYDDAATIYLDLLKRLNADITALDPSSGSFGSADAIYNGSPAAWIKFGNTFKIKMGILLSDSDPATATTAITSALANAGGIFTSNADNAEFAYLSAPPNTNQAWVGLVQSGRYDYVATDSYMTLLGSQNKSTPGDPRTPYYFGENKNGLYLGAPNAVNTITAANFSLPSGPLVTPGNGGAQTASIGSLSNPDFPGDMLDYSETEFYLAEAAARGFIPGGAATVLTYYTNGITASVNYWTGSDTGAAAIVTANPIGATETTQLQAIAAQQYLALYNRGYDAWTVNRRLDYPILTPPPAAISAFPVRFTYPNAEQQINVVNYNAAAKAIGGDAVTTRLWFDTKGPF